MTSSWWWINCRWVCNRWCQGCVVRLTCVGLTCNSVRRRPTCSSNKSWATHLLRVTVISTQCRWATFNHLRSVMTNSNDPCHRSADKASIIPNSRISFSLPSKCFKEPWWMVKACQVKAIIWAKVRCSALFKTSEIMATLLRCLISRCLWASITWISHKVRILRPSPMSK